MNNGCVLSNIPTETMAILGIGTDICSIERIDQIFARFKTHFLRRIFSEAECHVFYQLPHKKQIPFLAKRFAIKEAIAKSLHTGIGIHAYFTEITCLSGHNTPPTVTLTGKTHQTALLLAQRHNYARYHIYVSLSDETEYALAFTILTGLKK